MKRISLSIATLFLFLLADAQTEKGDWMVGGYFRLNTSDNNTEISLTPNAGLFVTDNFAVGGNIGLSHTKSGNNKYTSFGIGPFVRYYFTTETQKVRPVLHGAFNYLSTRNKIASNYSSTNTGVNFFVGGGAAAFISNNVSIDALIGYDRTKYKGFDGSGGFAFNIGFQVYINKRQMERLTGSGQ